MAETTPNINDMRLSVDAVHGEAMHDICLEKPPPGWGNPVVVGSVSNDDHPPLETHIKAERFARELVRRWNAHADILAALKDAEDLVDVALRHGLHFGSTTTKKIIDGHVTMKRIRAAITKAGG